jgi:TP901 family phage tail tape measure protein
MAADITSLIVEVKSVGIKEASTALSGLGTSAANAERRINSLIEATKKMNVANELAAKSTQSIVTRLREQDALLGNMAANSRVAARGTADLAAAMTLLSTSLNLMNQNLQRAEVVQRRHNNEMREAHALARGLSGSLGALWLTYGNFAGMAVGLAIGASLKGIVTVGVDVEHTLEGIRVRGNETVESIKNLREVVQDLGKGVYGPQEVAKALETLVLAGLNASQAASSIGAALNLATVGGVSIEKAATTLVSVGTAVGYVAEGFGRVGDVIAKTAALSMSSVESLSEAFKSASSVNRLYGVSLEDIGTSLGVLSNLGIKGTAAGTALKNFYKELAAESDKVGGTFRDMGITQAMLKDTEGNFKPLLEVVELVDGALKSLSASESKLAQGRISNERGQRLLTQLLGEYNTELGNGENALERFRKNVDNSYGFAAKGAAQMALTAKSQIDSMFNTLKSSFADTFTSIEPELIAFTARMKGIFNSKEFKDGIIGLAESFASLAISVAENLPLLAKLAATFVAIKVALGIVPLLQMLPGIFASITTAVAGLAAGTVTLTTLFPPLLAVVGAAIVALTAYNLLKGGGEADRSAKNAEAYSNGYLEGLIKEAEHLEKVNSKMKDRKSLSEINAEIEKDESRKRMIQLDQLAIKEAEANLAKTKGNFDVSAALKATNELDRARTKAANNLKLVSAAEEALFNQAKKNKELTEAIAKENRKVEQDEPTNKLSGKVDGAAMNDQYAASIAKLNAQVKAAKKDIQNFDDMLNSRFKAGEMGKLQVIRDSTKNQLEEYAKIDDALKKQITIASKGKNKQADVERFSGLQEANTEAIEQAKRKAAQETDVYISGLRQDAAKEQVKQFEEEGNFVAAAALRWSTEYAPAVKAVQKDFEKYGDTIPEIGERLRQLEELQASAMDSARVKELSKEYNVLALEIGNTLKGVQTASEDQGLAAMWNAAQDATDKYKASLPDLQAQLEKLKRFADAPDASTGDKKAYGEALNQQKSLAEKYKTMWTGVGKSISNSLSDAFGKSGKAAGGMVEAITKYHNTDNKSLGAKTKLYGDLANSAQGFFTEGSKGYKLMGVASQAASAIEIASSIATIAPKVASGVASLFAQGGWAGFAGAAAFLALMAGLGFSGGGSSSAPQTSEFRQKSNGTGSVLGDSSAKSDSIQRALDEIAKDSGLGLVHFNSMDKSLRQVVEGISGVSSLLVRGTNLSGPVAADQMGSAQKFANSIGGASIGEKLTGGLMGKVIGSIFGGKKSVEDVGIKIDKGSLAELLKGVTASQYTDIKKKGGLFSSDKYSTETKGLGDEINSQFTMIIKGLSDTVTGAANTLGIGGKAFEDKLKTFAINIAEISTKDMTGEEISAALESAFAKLGDDMAQFGVAGLADFQKVGEGYLETLARVANQLVQVQDVFAVLGISMTSTGIAAVESSQNFIALFGSIDKLTESTSYFVDNFLSDADKLKPIQESLTKEMNRLGLASTDTMEKFKNLVLAQDLNTKSGQEMYAALMNVAPAFIAVSEAAKNASDDLIESSKNSANNAFDSLSLAVDKAKDKAQKAYDAQAAILNAQVTSLTESRKAITELSSSLDSAFKTVTGFAESTFAMSRKQAQTNLDAALSTARKTGKLPSADEMKDTLASLSKDPADSFSSYSDYIKDIGITAGKLSNLNDITKEQGSAVDRQLDVAKSQLVLAKETLDMQNAKFDSILNAAQMQLDAMNGTTVAIMDLKTALISFNSAVGGAIGAQQQAGVVGSNGKPIGSGIASDAEIAALYESILGRKADSAGLAFWSSQRTSTSQIAADFMKSPEYLAKHPDGSHAGGLEKVPRDNYIARLHKGEKVLTAQQAEASRNGGDSATVVEAIEKSSELNMQVISEMQDDIRKLYKRFVDVTPEGTAVQTTSV